MADYEITKNDAGNFLVEARTERAQNRPPVGLPQGLRLVFKGRGDALEFVRAAEAEGFTFAGRDSLES